MPTPPKPPTELATLQQIERQLAELLVVSKKQLKALRDIEERRS
jgi:hypothetical protein